MAILIVSVLSYASSMPNSAAAAEKTIRVGSLSAEETDGCGTFVDIGKLTVLYSPFEERTLMNLDGANVTLSGVKSSGSLPSFTISGGGYTVSVKALKNVTPADAEETSYYKATLTVRKGSRRVTKAATLIQGC
jgi:hypothetical protein